MSLRRFPSARCPVAVLGCRSRLRLPSDPKEKKQKKRKKKAKTARADGDGDTDREKSRQVQPGKGGGGRGDEVLGFAVDAADAVQLREGDLRHRARVARLARALQHARQQLLRLLVPTQVHLRRRCHARQRYLPSARFREI